MELYVERGFENTTVAEIAERAGLTERTFFRHFADKREVLFSGSSASQSCSPTRSPRRPIVMPRSTWWPAPWRLPAPYSRSEATGPGSAKP